MFIAAARLLARKHPKNQGGLVQAATKLSQEWPPTNAWCHNLKWSDDRNIPWGVAVSNAGALAPYKPYSSEVLEVCRFLVSLYPDFVYTKPAGAVNCSYVKGGDGDYPEACGCIIGQACWALRCDLSTNPNASVKELIDLGYILSDHADSELISTQQNQDAGHTWSTACPSAA